MILHSILSSLIVLGVVFSQSKAFGVSRNKEFRGSNEVASKDGSNSEPSCEELKVMWRFSKRQSRASEVTNEIPTYRDPFSYNVWEPYYPARSRSIGGLPLAARHRTRPVYGRIVHKAPVLQVQDIAERNRAFEEVARMYGTVPRGGPPRRKVTSFRLSGGGHPLTPQSGSFQHLKELIKTERARELQAQRTAEEVAARAASLKELSGNGGFRSQTSLRDTNYNYDRERHDDEERGISEGREGIMVFPDLLAPAARSYQDDIQIEDYYPRDRPYKRTHSSSLFDTSSFNNDMDGMIL